MSNVPRYISGHYLYYIDIDLLEEGIDPEDVKDYYIKWHTLHITHMDDSVTEHEFPEIDWERMDTKRPDDITIRDENFDFVEFPKMVSQFRRG
jgi:hypothetical protein